MGLHPSALLQVHYGGIIVRSQRIYVSTPRGRKRPSCRSVLESNGISLRLGGDGDDLLVSKVIVFVEQARRVVLRLEVRLKLVQVDRGVFLGDIVNYLLRDLYRQFRCQSLGESEMGTSRHEHAP